MCVTRGLVAPIMDLAVDLDTEPRGQAGEVERTGQVGMLAAEFVPTRTLAEFAPEEHLGQIAGAALLAGMVDDLAGSAESERGGPSTTPLRVAVPLPVPGRY